MRIVSERTAPIVPNRNRKLDETAALANQLATALQDLNGELSRCAADGLAVAATQAPAGLDLRLDVSSARKLRCLRRRLFGEMDSGPAWDILLHLFESHVFERRDTVGNVTDGAELAGATALRWIARLEDEGLITLREDHLDRRRRFIELSASGVELMTKYFSGAAPNRVAA